MEYLFPFDKVRSGDRVLIYGYGKVGRTYIDQIRLTNYCKVIAIVDRMAEFIDASGYRIIYPNKIKEETFDKIIIALHNSRIVDDVVKNLLSMGIAQDEIITSCRRCIKDNDNLPFSVKTSLDDEIIHIGIDEGGGLGDTVLMLPLLKRFKELLGSKVEITFISKYAEIFHYISFVDYSYDKLENPSFDVFLKNLHIPMIIYWNPEKIERIAPLLYEYFLSVINIRRRHSTRFDGDCLWHYARVLDKKRFNICDFDDILKVKGGELIEGPLNEEEILHKYNLKNKIYITINRDVDVVSNMHNFKLWAEDFYNNLVSKLKSALHNVEIVRVGFRNNVDKFTNFDLDLTGRTNLSELLVILKNSKLLISSEGGLVHINHFLGGKSAVIYGPTDEKYFGYEEDIICVNRFPCEMPCQYISQDETCPRGTGIPQCMRNVTPQIVFDKIMSEFRDGPEYE